MRIGIDARAFGAKQQGHGRYTEMLLRSLADIDSHNDFFIFINGQVSPPSFPQNFHFIKTAIPWYGWREQVFFPFLLSRYKLNIMHFVHFNVPLLYRRPFIVTIHDLILFYFKTGHVTTRNYLYFRLKYFLFHIVFARAVKRTHHIIAISEFTKQDLLSHFPSVDKKTSVIYEGADPSTLLPSNTNDEQGHLEVPENFFLYVGNAYPHKNLEFLVKNFGIWQQFHTNFFLILAGRKDSFYEKLESYATESAIPNIIFLGAISDQTLNFLYQHTRAYIFPSLYEGFGLPPLEAMAKGAPVAASSAGSIPEVLGQAALFFNPTKDESLQTALTKIAEDQVLRADLVKKGFIQAKKFTWSAMGHATHKLYESMRF